MRLLRTDTDVPVLVHYNDERLLPPYAALSHTWLPGDGDEVTFQDLANLETARLKRGWDKVEQSRELARRDGIDYIWLDTCCIDKTSSAELAEAINSMFRWYQNCKVCYAFLDDVDRTSSAEGLLAQLSASRWFTRGWTLQELLAPSDVRFYDKAWHSLHDKNIGLFDIVSDITGIALPVLCRKERVQDYSIAQRMCWASERQTTRLEDRAYSLLGVFGINMYILYGEGNNAFIRLQEELLKQSNDQSILAWIHQDYPNDLLAPSLDCFRNSACFVNLPTTARTTLQADSRSIRIGCPLVENQKVFGPDGALRHTLPLGAVLNCRGVNDSATAVVLNLSLNQSADNAGEYVVDSRKLMRIMVVDSMSVPSPSQSKDRVTILRQNTRDLGQQHHGVPRIVALQLPYAKDNGGYTLEHCEPASAWVPGTSNFVLSGDADLRGQVTVKKDGVKCAVIEFDFPPPKRLHVDRTTRVGVNAPAKPIAHYGYYKRYALDSLLAMHGRDFLSPPSIFVATDSGTNLCFHVDVGLLLGIPTLVIEITEARKLDFLLYKCTDAVLVGSAFVLIRTIRSFGMTLLSACTMGYWIVRGGLQTLHAKQGQNIRVLPRPPTLIVRCRRWVRQHSNLLKQLYLWVPSLLPVAGYWYVRLTTKTQTVGFGPQLVYLGLLATGQRHENPLGWGSVGLFISAFLYWPVLVGRPMADWPVFRPAVQS